MEELTVFLGMFLFLVLIVLVIYALWLVNQAMKTESPGKKIHVIREDIPNDDETISIYLINFDGFNYHKYVCTYEAYTKMMDSWVRLGYTVDFVFKHKL